ncbi:MAG TPA: hypothetical protein VKF59_13645, partial [Candidatus Dormibacteraeota bacterium]|nr:hypothetical protein [Candidatus Dormibacteraeota bacterium]
GFGAEPERDPERLEATATFVRRACRGEAGVSPLPHTPGGPPLMIAADGPGDAGPARAARLADVMMVDPTETWDRTREVVDAYRRLGGRGEVALFTYGAISEQGARVAWSEIEAGFRHMRHTYDRWMGRPPTRRLPPTHHRLLLGTVPEVAGQVFEHLRAVGDSSHLVLRLNYPGMPHSAVLRQIDLWGRVADRVRHVYER